MRSDGLLVTAHHAQDQSETLLLRMLQGRGLVGIRQHSRVSGLAVARPLLNLSKSTLTTYTRNFLRSGAEGAAQGEAKSGLENWIEDPSNRDVDYDRNFLRQQVMPDLYERWPALDQAFARVAHHQMATESALYELVAKAVTPQGLSVDVLGDSDQNALVILRAYLSLAEIYQVTDRALLEFLRQVRRGQNAKVSVGSLSLVHQASWVRLKESAQTS